MKALEEMSAEELIALAKQKDSELAAKNKEVEDSEAIVAKLKAQVESKKDLKASKTTVKHDGKTYVFSSESWTEPDGLLAGDTTVHTAEDAVKDKEYIAALVERKFLKEVKAVK